MTVFNDRRVQDLAEIFQCKPIQGAWDLSIEKTCLSQHDLYLGGAIPNVITDVGILLLPAP